MNLFYQLYPTFITDSLKILLRFFASHGWEKHFGFILCCSHDSSVSIKMKNIFMRFRNTRQTGWECITDNCKLKASFPKAITSPSLPQKPAMTEEKLSLHSHRNRTAPKCSPVNVSGHQMGWDSKWDSIPSRKRGRTDWQYGYRSSEDRRVEGKVFGHCPKLWVALKPMFA